MPAVISQNNSKLKKKAVINDSNLPSSGQRSLKSLKVKSGQGKQNFMLIYEENLDEQQASTEAKQDEQKVINVSFNDFNHSISNDNANIENSIELESHPQVSHKIQTI